jgi:AcrR family transcriptional regulator
MPARSRQRRTQAERREVAERLILDAATRLVAERGPDAFTLAEAGQAAGYSGGLPAHYFRSKTALLVAVAEHVRQWFFARLHERVQARRGLPQLIAAIDFSFEACRTDRTMMLALHTVLAGALHRLALAAPIARYNRESAAIAEAAIRDGIANGEIRRGTDARAWSILILSSVRGVVAQWLVDPGHVDLSVQRNRLIGSIRHNFAP